MTTFLQGKKTYIVLGLFLIAFCLWQFAGIEIPEQIIAILVAFGFGAFRSALRGIQSNQGWKTYIAVIATIVISSVDLLGFNISQEMITLIYTVTGSLGVIGIRDAVSKLKA